MSETRKLPQNLDAERAVLGAILLDPVAAFPPVLPILKAEDFFDRKNARIYRGMLDLFKRSSAVDQLTLKEELNGGGPETVDGEYLSWLSDKLPDIGNAEHWARIVKEKSILRLLIQVGQKAVQGALDQEKDARTLLAQASTEIQAIEQVAQQAAIAADGISELDLPDGWLRGGEVLLASPLPKARFKTGIDALNEASRGGLPTGAVIVFQGEPDAGKTGLALQIALKIAMDQDVVEVIYAPDGGRENAEIRLGALLDFDAKKLEEREPCELEALRAKLADRRIYFPDHSREDTTFASIVSEGARIEPHLPHLYLVDSIQECRATEESDSLDERRRVVEIMRGMQKATTGTVPTLCLACSQTNTASFASPKPRDRTRPIAAGAESGKISFLSSLIVHLDGDPSKGPEWGRARVVKSKLGGGKPTFDLRLDPVTTRLREIDGIEAAREREESSTRDREKVLSKLGDGLLALLVKEGRLNVSAIRERVSAKRADVLAALNGLEAQKAARWTLGPKGSHVWEVVRG